MEASYTKLRSGSWGVRVVGTAPEQGSSISVRTKAGVVKTERISAIVWSGDGVALCAIEERSQRSYSRRSGGGGGCHTDGNCSSVCNPSNCPCGDGSWFRCC
jgi:hypothetical protein